MLLLIAGVLFIGKNLQIKNIERNFSDLRNKVEEEVNQTPTKEQVKTKSFLEPTNPKQATFQWEHDNKRYELTMTLYKSIDDYYGEQPKKYSYTGTQPQDWEQQYYEMFINVPKEDNTFSKLASELEAMGERNNLSDDEIVDLTVAFIQSIPYDEAKSVNDSFLARYPYEVLYDKKGVCSEKSFLGALLIKEMDYGVSLFSFEEAKHMVMGVKCPEQYDSYDSGYCFTELTTPGWKVGVEDFQDIEAITSTSKTPSLREVPQIYEVADGKTYHGVIETMEEKERIKTLKTEIERLDTRINNLKEDLEYYERVEDYESYNNLVPVYNDLVAQHKEKVEAYNNLGHFPFRGVILP